MSVYIYFFLFFLYLSLIGDGVNLYFQGRHWISLLLPGIIGLLFVFLVLWKTEFLFICITGGFFLFFSDLNFLGSLKFEIWKFWKYILISLNSILLIYAAVNASQFRKLEEKSLYFKFKELSSYRAVLYFASILLLFGWLGGIVLFVP